MIAPATGEVHFHDGLVIVAHCPVALLATFAIPKSF